MNANYIPRAAIYGIVAVLAIIDLTFLFDLSALAGSLVGFVLGCLSSLLAALVSRREII